MSNRIYGCGLPGCLVCGPQPSPRESWRRSVEVTRRAIEASKRAREREAERLRRLYPQPSPLQRIVETIKARRAAR